MDKTASLKQRSFTPTGKEQIAVQMDGLSSMELYAQPDGRYLKVLYDLSLTVPVGVCHGITGDEAFALQLLSEIIGNVKPHEKGTCSLMEIGMMRQKRLILPHVYYINDQRVLFEHMHVLGYLMFASEHAPDTPEHRQRDLLRLLLRTGLYPFTLTYIRSLNPAEYALVSALVAHGSNARLIVMDFSHIDVPEALIAPLSALMRELTAVGKTVVLSSRSRELVQSACTSASFLMDGTITISGRVDALCGTYDRRVLQVTAHRQEAAAEALKAAFPMLRILPHAGGVSLYADGENQNVCSVSAAAKILEAAVVPFTEISVPKPSLDEAYREVKRRQ